ncbi:hypothetical protein EDB81DRAFT_655028 [Dactylonectria macrodidyma]|uniref:Uncharacterized protein n=1 Tax=Dactylonectria macrodidyma TaxID=307937 RepID=A0A9P9EJD3_9HYPO|nr:hypothetical protein EDB81DRAFT_655028 [Dactylonectria macrodidyma]
MPRYPGLGLDLRYHDQINAAGNTDLYPMGIHHNCFGSTSDMLLIREVAMMTVMDRLSDKPDFHIKVFDDAITNKWIDEALALPVPRLYDEVVKGSDFHGHSLGDSRWDRQKRLKGVLDKACLDYCINELRAKAQFFQKTGLIPTLDASASIVKSDTIVDESLHNALRAAFCGLEEDQKDNPDWLPSNLRFQDDGTVKFTSYINNLHPIKNSDIYSTIEKLVEKSLPAWDLCLARYHDYRLEGGGRTTSRFLHPTTPDDEEEANWTPRFDEVETPPGEKSPSGSVLGADSDEDFEDEEQYGRYFAGTRKEAHWYKTREPVLPEAPEFEAWDYGVKPGASLREMFDGLQIIVKMVSIELGPGKPEFPPGGWHVEGQMNEHIVGTALYYLDSENVTPSHLQFRMQTSTYQDSFEVRQDAFHWMEQVYGAKLGAGSGGPCLQSYGSVETKEGRLLAFPNVFHHRVSHFGLKDETKTGHRRFIALWLVDPLTRIISTANVPPQQQNWWVERAFGNLGKDEAAKVPQAIAQLILEKAPGHTGLETAGKRGQGLPPELMDIVRGEFGDALPMSLDEAKEHRLKLMDARTTFQKEARDLWEEVDYNFCEH